MSATAMLVPPASPRARLERVLAASPLPELRRLAVNESDAEIVISGHVSCFYLKQLAQESIKAVANGKRVLNRVVVAHKN